MKKKQVKRKKLPSVCVELKSGKTVCFEGSLEAVGYLIDLIGSGKLTVTSIK